ncbi:hypothetical protein [Marivirga sp.]|uniref:hypothetical protein n=1 Tax=Marivirga sp. TaxID=2018662 RepID=UPI0025E25637|nr:hypothetical protein [Marivirga sp.]
MRISKTLILLVFLTLNLQAICKDLKLILISKQDVYIAGSTVDFKIEGRNTEINSNIYLEILDAKNNKIQTEIYKIGEIPYQNEIKLSSHLVSGDYLLNSFNLAKNEVVSSEAITVINLGNFSQSNTKNSKELNHKISTVNKTDNFSFENNIRGIINKEGKPQKNISIFLQCNGEDNLFRISETDDNGVFEFNPIIYGANEVYIDQLDGVHSKISIEIINNDYLDLLHLNESTPLPYYSKELKNIDSTSFKELVKQHANNLKGKQSPDKSSNDLIFDESIDASDYFTLGSTAEFISELLRYKKIKTKKNDTRLYLLNKYSSSYYKSEPLYLIDGFIVPDIETILSIEIENLKSIDVSYSSQDNLQFFGELAFYGVVQLNTKDDSFKPKSGILISFKGFNK